MGRQLVRPNECAVMAEQRRSRHNRRVPQSCSQSGRYGGLALKNDGRVVSWGFSCYGATSVPVGLTNVLAIAAGGNHGVALVSPDPPLLHPFLLNPSMSTAGFSVNLPTQNGNVYGLEFKNSLSYSSC